MKKLTILVAVIGMFAFAANAQTKDAPKTTTEAKDGKAKSCAAGETKSCCKGKSAKSCSDMDKKKGAAETKDKSTK